MWFTDVQCIFTLLLRRVFIFVESAQENVSGKKHFGITPETLDTPNFVYCKDILNLYYVLDWEVEGLNLGASSFG